MAGFSAAFLHNRLPDMRLWRSTIWGNGKRRRRFLTGRYGNYGTWYSLWGLIEQPHNYFHIGTTSVVQRDTPDPFATKGPPMATLWGVIGGRERPNNRRSMTKSTANKDMDLYADTIWGPLALWDGRMQDSWPGDNEMIFIHRMEEWKESVLGIVHPLRKKRLTTTQRSG